jgi:hypothetical protein
MRWSDLQVGTATLLEFLRLGACRLGRWRDAFRGCQHGAAKPAKFQRASNRKEIIFSATLQLKDVQLG